MSQHPTDQLISELIAGRREASEEEINRIIQRISNASFSTQLVRVPPKLRGRTYRGRVLSTREDSLTLHLAQRIAEGQLKGDVTPAEYLSFLHDAVRDQDARLLVYSPPKGPVAAVLAPNRTAHQRLGENALPFVYVVYAADRAKIISGYQASGVDSLAIPKDAKWLK